jgi:maleate isomerase
MVAVDTLGYRSKIGVVAPSTNTVVQPELDAMRPIGVTNHFGRIHIPDDPLDGDDDFERLMVNIKAQLIGAIERVATCRPDHIVLGMSAETFWEGLDGADNFTRSLEAHTGIPVSGASEACRAALDCYGNVRRIAVVTPYMPAADERVRIYFEQCGYSVARINGLRCTSPTAIAHVSEQQLRDAIIDVDHQEVDAIMVVGTNLPAARVAGIAEFWLDKPVISVNTASYWWALRQRGIEDKIHGWGSLLSRY